MKMYEIGNVVEFEYAGKLRRVKIEKVKRSPGNLFVGPQALLVMGWDYNADYPTGGYRSFKTEKIENPVLVG